MQKLKIFLTNELKKKILAIPNNVSLAPYSMNEDFKRGSEATIYFITKELKKILKGAL